ncbi:MAG TPA: glucosyl-3-phosphoglycerate synthase [Acidimicrobiales bacterium]|nr:glucosyl-3-phosphoglycerate synthase [Acidimicrobiales bacterium]
MVKAKGETSVSVCLPARNEAATIGAIVTSIVHHLVERQPLVDEVVVVDDGSTDATAEVALQAGARVVATTSPDGKGGALRTSLAASTGDLVVWCDADILGFQPSFVTGLLAPLLADPSVDFVKARYRRDLDGQAGEGGRVTELVARPLLARLFPHLSGFAQPLAGEYAGRRTLLEQLDFVPGYGVDLGLLIDIAQRVGVGAMVQVDLGRRAHRNRPLAELVPQADAILAVALDRAGIGTPQPFWPPERL